MKFQLPFTPDQLNERISYNQSILLIGSCFTENIGKRLSALKFNTLQNPNGIIYDPVSITESIVSYIDDKEYSASDLIHLNDIWHSWRHHGSFSGASQAKVLAQINDSRRTAHAFIKNCDWVFITLGSAFSYKLAEDGSPVANCHKAPAKTFHKEMLTIEQIKSTLDTCIHRLFHFNKKLKIIFTVSPVRYVRDGLVENNISKARLIEVVQHLVNKFDRLYYFPAYELVNDVLRDYRFFKEDMVHPSDQAIDFVFDAFKSACFDKDTIELSTEIERLNNALAHRPIHPESAAHAEFRQQLLTNIKGLEQRHPYLDFSAERLACAAGD